MKCFVALLAVLLLSGCPNEVCLPTNTACNTPDPTGIECPDNQVLTLLDCGPLGEAGWACCNMSIGDCTCVEE